MNFSKFQIWVETHTVIFNSIEFKFNRYQIDGQNCNEYKNCLHGLDFIQCQGITIKKTSKMKK